MKFYVSKTSSYENELQPCEDAFREDYIRIDTRSVDTPVKIPFYKGDEQKANFDWYSNGNNHRVENGNLKRDFIDTGWFIEINSLEELINFKTKIKEKIIISNLYNNESIPEIEIYDSWRE